MVSSAPVATLDLGAALVDLLRRLKSPDSQSHYAAFGASHFAATSTSEAPCAVTACPSAKPSFRIPRSRIQTDAVISDFSDLGQPVPVPRGVPWYPDDLEAWSVRWVLSHLISETARHAGHADIIREGVDTTTTFPLMAAAEARPATPWMQPWEPAGNL